MRLLPNLIAILLLFTLLGCERERILPLQKVEPVLVIHSVISPGDPLEISLQSSGNLTNPEGGQGWINTADFTIQQNDQLYSFNSMKSISPGDFLFKYIIPKPGDFIRIEVRASGIQPCQAELFVPQNALSTIEGIQIDESGMKTVVNTTLLLDQPGSDPAPFIVYATGTMHNAQSGEVEDIRFRVSSVHPAIDDRFEGAFSDKAKLLFVNPKDIQEQKLEFSIEGVPASFSTHHPKQKVTVVAEKLTPDLFEYYISLEMANTFDFDKTVQEPINVHTNIKGGIGILGAAQRTTLDLHW